MSNYEQYHKKGGEYIIPVEVFEELLEENEELQNKIHTLEDELNWYKQECDDLEMRIGLDE